MSEGRVARDGVASFLLPHGITERVLPPVIGALLVHMMLAPRDACPPRGPFGQIFRQFHPRVPVPSPITHTWPRKPSGVPAPSTPDWRLGCLQAALASVHGLRSWGTALQ